MSLYNMLFGQNPMAPMLLGFLGLDPASVPRFRDVHLSKEDGVSLIAVYTRMGGGNRECWERYDHPDQDAETCGCYACAGVRRGLMAHPLYVRDEDDDFDCTYATYYFKVPPAYQEAIETLESIPAQTERPEERFKVLLDKLKNAAPDDPDVVRATTKLAPMIEAIGKALAQP